MLGVALIFLGWTSTFWLLSALAFLGMLMIIIALFTTAQILEERQEAEDPYYFDDLVLDKRWEKVLNWGSGILMIVGFLLLAYLDSWGENIIRQFWFFVLCGGIGAVIASVFMFFWKKWKPHIFIKNETRQKELSCIWLGIIFFVIAGCEGLMFFTPSKYSHHETVEIMKHGADQSNPERTIWINWNGEKMELHPTLEAYNATKGRESATLVIHRGVVGFDFVKAIE